MWYFVICLSIALIIITFTSGLKINLVIILFCIIPFCIVIIIAITQLNKRNSQKIADEEFIRRREESEHQRVESLERIHDTSNGRKIDGHPLRTPEDWERWSVYDHQATDASSIVQNCIKFLSSAYCDDPDGTLELATRKYREYEELCTRYGMWNNLIKDHMVYVPTYEQKSRSAQYMSEIASLVEGAKQRKAFYDGALAFILDYLQTCARGTGYRADIIREIGSAMEIVPSEAAKAVRVLCNKGFIREGKNQAGRITIRKATGTSSIAGSYESE